MLRFPLGSILHTNSPLGHELIAGPVVNGQQIVGLKEPGRGAYPETLPAVTERYQITQVTPPLNHEHGMVSWARMEQQFGQPPKRKVGSSNLPVPTIS